MRTIYLPATGMTVTIGQYVRAIKLAKANPEAEFKHGLTTWWSTSGKQIMEQFYAGLTQRINDGMPYSIRWQPVVDQKAKRQTVR